jgi:hypothetical protein
MRVMQSVTRNTALLRDLYRNAQNTLPTLKVTVYWAKSQFHLQITALKYQVCYNYFFVAFGKEVRL